MTPEEILEQALQNHVEILAITDHDVLEASIELKKLCSGQGLHYISGVELDASQIGEMKITSSQLNLGDL